MGAVENLAVGQLALHVAHDALPQRAHPGQVVRECRVHDAKDALPAFSGHESSCAPFATLASHSRASSVHGCHRLRRSVRRIRRSEIRRTLTVAPNSWWMTISVSCSSPGTSCSVILSTLGRKTCRSLKRG